MRKPPLDPEPSASTSSATSAKRQLKMIDLSIKVVYLYGFRLFVKINMIKQALCKYLKIWKLYLLPLEMR